MNRHIRISNCSAVAAMVNPEETETKAVTHRLDLTEQECNGMINFDNNSLSAQIKAKMTFTQVIFD
jgi:hypothetical protein